MTNTEQKTERKPNVFQRVKNWWDGLSDDQRWMCVCGIWTIDGLMIGSSIANARKEKQLKQAEAIGATKGYILGQMDAYKELAQNPHKAIDLGEKNSTMKRINF